MQLRQPFEEGSEDDMELYNGEEQVASIKKRKKKKRRFSDEQVRSLETIFSSETKPEHKKKVQVATELGLQPRQVAIWFQNKRARWKSKQIHNNYTLLQADYDDLKARFQDVSKQNQTLLHQLQELQSLSEKSSTANSKQFGRENRNTISGLPEIDDQVTVMYSDDDKSGNMARDEPVQLMNIGVNTDEAAAMISSLKWCGFDSPNLLDQSSSDSHWWDPWTPS